MFPRVVMSFGPSLWATWPPELRQDQILGRVRFASAYALGYGKRSPPEFLSEGRRKRL